MLGKEKVKSEPSTYNAVVKTVTFFGYRMIFEILYFYDSS